MCDFAVRAMVLGNLVGPCGQESELYGEVVGCELRSGVDSASRTVGRWAQYCGQGLADRRYLPPRR